LRWSFRFFQSRNLTLDNEGQGGKKKKEKGGKEKKMRVITFLNIPMREGTVSERRKRKRKKEEGGISFPACTSSIFSEKEDLETPGREGEKKRRRKKKKKKEEASRGGSVSLSEEKERLLKRLRN